MEGNKIVALEEGVGKGHYRKQAGSQGDEEGKVDFEERLDASPKKTSERALEIQRTHASSRTVRASC